MSNSPVDELLGKNLQKCRKEADLTQHALGTMIDLSAQQVSKFEAGIDRISCSQMVAIAEVLNVSILTLMDGVAKMSRKHKAEYAASVINQTANTMRKP